MADVTLGIAFLAGLLSFFTPCTVPLLPIFLAYLSGIKIGRIEQETKIHWKLFLTTISFVVGFGSVFVFLGFLMGLFGQAFFSFQTWLTRIGGALIILMGIFMLGFLRIPWMFREHDVKIKAHHVGYFSAVVVGATMGLSWTPCSSPVLASILMAASASRSVNSGTLLLGMYALGHAVPFLIAGLFSSAVSRFIQRESRYFRFVSIILGMLMIVLGVFLLLQKYYLFASLLS